MRTDLELGRITVAGCLDSDGEVEFETEAGDDVVSSWVNRDETLSLIKHLKKTFDLTEEELAV